MNSVSAFEFTDDHRVALVNLEGAYDAWLQARRMVAALDFNFQVKRQEKAGGGAPYAYLYRMTDSKNGYSLGPWTKGEALDQLRERHLALKTEAVAVENERWAVLEGMGRQYKALRFGQIASEAALILRRMDTYGFIGNKYMIVGTNAMPVYEIEAGARFASDVQTTKDFDLAWLAGNMSLFAQSGKPLPWNPATLLGLAEGDPLLDHLNQPPKSLRALLKEIDSTYTLNTERRFQIRNRAGYEVEVLLAPSLVDQFPRTEELSPIMNMEEQDWLLLGKQVQHVVAGRDGTPARVIAPDPRYFALQKIWLSHQEKRDPLKRPKDFAQGVRVMDAVKLYMPHYPIDDEFIQTLPRPLMPHFESWKKMHETKVANGSFHQTSKVGYSNR